jgi:hypothetical protein
MRVLPDFLHTLGHIQSFALVNRAPESRRSMAIDGWSTVSLIMRRTATA